MAGTEALRMENVVFRYRENARRNILDGVTLSIPENTITVLMGASGCGKSTLAAVTAGLYPENGGFLADGDVFLFGHHLSAMTQQERAHYLTICFQNADLQFCMDTLRKEMRFCLENIRISPAEMDSRIDAAADLLGISTLMDRKLHTLSGGEKQRAALACLFVMESKCILLDESFANLDQDAARQIIQMLVQFRMEGRTIIAVDHQVDLWLDAADEIILLGEGAKVVARGIQKETIAEFVPSFQKEGVFLPVSYTPNPDCITHAPNAVSLEAVTISPADKRKGFRVQPAIPLLLEKANASFPAGAMSAILGPSGCGKSTTFLSILKQHPYSGTILINGTPLSSISRKDLYRQVGIVFQNPANQFITQNVRQEVLESLRLWNPTQSEEWLNQTALQKLEEFGLSRYQKYSPYMLSQGQQRRLAVLAVLCGRQKILLLDEPTYGQDARSTEAIFNQLRRKMTGEGLTVIFITHDRRIAAQWADKLYQLDHRKLVQISSREVL